MTPLYARDSRAALIVFDMSRRETFDTLDSWIDFLQHQGNDIPFVIAGNKEDLADNTPNSVTIEEGTEYGFKSGGKFFPVSAKTGVGVDLVFRQLEFEAVDDYKRKGPGEHDYMTDITAGNAYPERNGCC